MSLDLIDAAAEALGELRNRVVFLGAATLPVWISDPAAREPRPTADVDVVVEVTTRRQYYRFEERMREEGFRDEGTVVGRFLYGPENRQLDVIPSDASILGFDNEWQRKSLPQRLSYTTLSGLHIYVLPAPNLLATKLEAFAGRGLTDYFGSPDFEDIVHLIDGREELARELRESDAELIQFVQSNLAPLVADPRAREATAAHISSGPQGARRAELVTLPRIVTMLEPGEGQVP